MACECSISTRESDKMTGTETFPQAITAVLTPRLGVSQVQTSRLATFNCGIIPHSHPCRHPSPWPAGPTGQGLGCFAMSYNFSMNTAKPRAGPTGAKQWPFQSLLGVSLSGSPLGTVSNLFHLLHRHHVPPLTPPLSSWLVLVPSSSWPLSWSVWALVLL